MSIRKLVGRTGTTSILAVLAAAAPASGQALSMLAGNIVEFWRALLARFTRHGTRP